MNPIIAIIDSVIGGTLMVLSIGPCLTLSQDRATMLALKSHPKYDRPVIQQKQINYGDWML